MSGNRKRVKGGRQVIINIRVTEEERDALHAKAQERSKTLTLAIMDSMLGEDPVVAAEIWANELRGLRRVAHKEGFSPDVELKIMELLERIGK